MRLVIAIIIGLALGVYLGDKFCDSYEPPVASAKSDAPIQLEDVTGKRLKEVGIQDDSEEWKNVDCTYSRKFSKKDIELAKLAVKFMEKVAGADYPESYLNMYWSDDVFTEAGYYGITAFVTVKREPWKAYIIIASELKPASVHDLNAMRDFGSVVVHEMDHAAFLTHEPIVRSKIDQTIAMAYDFYFHMSITNFHRLNEEELEKLKNERYETLLERAASDVGIDPPWIASCDYHRPQYSSILRLITVPPSTNTTNNVVSP